MSFLYSYYLVQPYLLSFFFNDPATTDIYTLSLHDALPICKVAIKVLKPELAAALGPERFLQEIEIAAGLTHPHILPLHDSGEATGLLYYMMPYVAGAVMSDFGIARAITAEGGEKLTGPGIAVGTTAYMS